MCYSKWSKVFLQEMCYVIIKKKKKMNDNINFISSLLKKWLFLIRKDVCDFIKRTLS